MQTRDDEKQETSGNNATEQQPLNPENPVNNNQDNRDEQQESVDIAGNTIICLSASQFVIPLMFGWAFYYLSTTESKYGGDDCKKLRSDSLIFGYVLLIGSALGLLCMGYCYLQKRTMENLVSAGQCVNCINSVIGFISFILTIIIAVDYFENEPCGTLRTFVGVLLILWCVCFALGCCVCCLAILFGVASR